jgi:hypothetical protein
MGKECLLFNLVDSELIRFDSQVSLDRYLKLHPEVTLEARKRNTSYAKRQKKIGNNNKFESMPQLFED